MRNNPIITLAFATAIAVLLAITSPGATFADDEEYTNPEKQVVPLGPHASPVMHTSTPGDAAQLEIAPQFYHQNGFDQFLIPFVFRLGLIKRLEINARLHTTQISDSGGGAVAQALTGIGLGARYRFLGQPDTGLSLLGSFSAFLPFRLISPTNTSNFVLRWTVAMEFILVTNLALLADLTLQHEDPNLGFQFTLGVAFRLQALMALQLAFRFLDNNLGNANLDADVVLGFNMMLATSLGFFAYIEKSFDVESAIKFILGVGIRY
ncbi:MAG: hypothetical protein AB7S36_11555 [Planctomycetota bacterium]